jgi:hypothetical protein
MARRDLESAVRLRLSPSQDAVISRRGVLLVRGDEVWRLDDREARRLADEIGGGSLADAVSRLLAADSDPTT